MLFSKEPLIAVCGPEFDVPDEVDLTDLLLKRLCVREHGSGSRDLLERTLAEYSLSLEDFPYRAEIGSPQTIKHWYTAMRDSRFPMKNQCAMN